MASYSEIVNKDVKANKSKKNHDRSRDKFVSMEGHVVKI